VFFAFLEGFLQTFTKAGASSAAATPAAAG
jgi:hypothetical protein